MVRSLLLHRGVIVEAAAENVDVFCVSTETENVSKMEVVCARVSRVVFVEWCWLPYTIKECDSCGIVDQ